ncbi:hypothetical protein P1X16_21100 [Hymenobacter sp. YC55]|nr:hypothetical protein [Hymenobacter sp. YC55]
MYDLVFAYTARLSEVRLRPGLRTSLWAEQEPGYQMPCEFIHVEEVSGSARATALARLRVRLLDSTRVSERHLHTLFLFGHPGRIVGQGHLLALVPAQE